MLSSPGQRAHAEQTRWPPLDKGLVGRFPTAPAPYESEADIHHVISVGSVIPGSFERIKKPFIPIPDIYKGLIRHKKFRPYGGPHRSCDVSVVPNHPTKYTEVRH